MRILFEEYPYKGDDKDIIKNIIGNFVLTAPQKNRDTLQLKSVGYFYNNKIENKDGTKGDFVIILPKVLLDANNGVLSETALGISIEEFVNFKWEDWKDKDDSVNGNLTRKQVYDFVYGFSIWFYRAIDLYRKNQTRKTKEEREKEDESEEVEVDVLTSIKAIGNSGRYVEHTFMDVVLALLDFQRLNRNFITFVMKMSHSGMNKISWQKTISKSQAVIQDGVPVYVDLIHKKRFINFDEELIIIFYSILYYLHEEYGFTIGDIPGYKLITGGRFKSYIDGIGKSRLRKIRYKYYSDKAVALWNLCFMFFDKAGEIRGNSNNEDYLLVNKFETVFEAMIDELIGDKDLPNDLKSLSDGKRIDHLYKYKRLIENLDGEYNFDNYLNMYNIADSKYYRRDKNLGEGASVPKQFTYARNVIQWHMDLLHDLYKGKDAEKVKDVYGEITLYDKVTEGFNIIPNFFISALVDDELNYDDDNFGLTKLGKKCQNETNNPEDGSNEWEEGENYHQSLIFWERLFDRNTYFALHYDVNFLFVLKKYARNNSAEKDQWRSKVRDDFRRKMLKFFNDHYDFYQILTPNIKEFVDIYFRQLRGRVFSFKTEDKTNVLLYAERRNQNNPEEKYKKSCSFDSKKDAHVENGVLVIPLGEKSKKYFKVVKMTLGTSKYEDISNSIIIPNAKYEIETDTLKTYSKGLGDIVEPSMRVGLIGYYKSEAHLKWIEYFHIYYVRTSKPMTKTQINAKYLILYNEKLGTHFFKIKSLFPRLMFEDKKYNEYNQYSVGEGYHYMYDLEAVEINDFGISIDEINKKIKMSTNGAFWQKGIILPNVDVIEAGKREIKVYDVSEEENLLFAADSND